MVTSWVEVRASVVPSEDLSQRSRASRTRGVRGGGVALDTVVCLCDVAVGTSGRQVSILGQPTPR